MTAQKLLYPVALAALLSVPAVGSATIAVRVTDGTTTCTVYDQQADPDGAGPCLGDAAPAIGDVEFDGSLGAWSIAAATGYGSSGAGFSTHLDGEARLDTGTGSLTVMFTQTGITYGAGGLANILGSIGGSVQGDLSWALYIDSSNAEFGTGTTVFSGLFDGPGAFASNDAASLMLSNPYSMTLVGTFINPIPTRTSSFDYNASVEVPEPAALTLLGLGIMGLAFARRRRS